ncbi:MAG: CinA family protein, partial [Candidatus Bipolaricaulaceae bacterium]
YGSDDETLPLVLARMLTHQHLTLACAESCTGGLVAKLMTDIPGSSAYFREGLVTYANEAKVARLGVSPSTLERYGAVSEETAREMLEGLLARTNAQVATAITGIAGPTGGTPEKPVGLVYIALAHPEGVEVERHEFRGSRQGVRWSATEAALSLLHHFLEGR